MIRITLDIEPRPWKRVKRGAYGQAYVDPKTLRYKNTIASLVRASRVTSKPLAGPLKLTARFIVAAPKKPKWWAPAVRPDLDNYLKAIKDACNGLLWSDDAQIVHVDARKLYDMAGGPPRVELEVNEVSA
jgi:Holliday junction resolvase RusA-like endonuclease